MRFTKNTRLFFSCWSSYGWPFTGQIGVVLALQHRPDKLWRLWISLLGFNADLQLVILP